MKLEYRPEIDGLRAIAVLPVLLFHAGFRAFSGGFVGVDVFFVISGYLITAIIVKDVNAGTFSFWEFYERRARRILPAMFLVMLCCIPFAWMWMPPIELKAFSTSVLSVCLFASNFLFSRQSGYFDAAAELKPLLHTWSLAVEEQYYIIFPIALLSLWRLGRRNAIWSIALVAILSLALSEYASRSNPSTNFYMLPTRAWELMAGALCSFAVLRPSILRDNFLSLAGLVAVAVSVFVYDETFPFPSLYALPLVLGTCAILVFARQGTLVGSLLSLKPVVGIGLISYSAYLWHQPLFAFARIRSMTEPTWQLMLGLSIISLALAYLSWRFVEVPLRRRGTWPFPNRRTTFSTFSMVAAAFIVVGMSGYLSKGFPSRIPVEAAYIASFSEDKNPRDDCASSPQRPLPPSQACIYGIGKKQPQFAILGDSHAHALAFELGKALSIDSSSLIEFTQAGCPPIYAYRWMAGDTLYDCNSYHIAVMDQLRRMPNVTTVLLAARWPLYIYLTPFNNGEGGIEEGMNGINLLKADFISEEEADIRSKIGERYQASIAELLSLGKNVVLVYPQPEVGWNVPDYLYKSILLGAHIKRPLSTQYKVFKERTKLAYEKLDAITSDHVLRIYPETIFCNTIVRDRCAAEDGKVPFYSDDDHVDSVGAEMISTKIIEAMQQKGWLDENSGSTRIGHQR